MSIGHRPSRGGRNAPGHRWEIALSSIRPASAPGAARLPAGIRTRVEAALADCSRPPETLNNTNVTGWRDVGARQRPQAVWALGSLFRQPCQLLLHQVAIDAFALHQHLRRTVFADPARLQHDDPAVPERVSGSCARNCYGSARMKLSGSRVKFHY
jgi:hypothetical protein